MTHYIIRRLLFAVPTLAAISFILFALLDLAPNDPTVLSVNYIGDGLRDALDPRLRGA